MLFFFANSQACSSAVVLAMGYHNWINRTELSDLKVQ
jgi:hypothetical protein